MSEEYNDQAGPSGVKRRKVTITNPNKLTIDEMLHLMDCSDDEDETFRLSSDDDLDSESEEENDGNSFRLFLMFCLLHEDVFCLS